MDVFPIKNDNKGSFYLFGYCDRCHHLHDSKGYYYVAKDGTLICYACMVEEWEVAIKELGEYEAHKSNPHPEIMKVNRSIFPF